MGNYIDRMKVNGTVYDIRDKEARKRLDDLENKEESPGNIDAYTKEESDARYASKGNSYTKGESDTRYASKEDLEQKLDKATADALYAPIGSTGTTTGGGISSESADLLCSILSEGIYGSVQLANIESLRIMLKSSAPVTPTKTLTSITATYSGGSVVEGTSVNSLTGIVVTAHYSDGTSNTVTGYTRSGNITVGSNTVTLTYQGKSTTIIVTGTANTSPEPKRTLQSISATYTGGAVDAGTPATSLTGITVTGHYNVEPLTETVTGWSITGTVAEGQNTFTISYNGKTTTISVTGNAVVPGVSRNLLDPSSVFIGYSFGAARNSDGIQSYTMEDKAEHICFKMTVIPNHIYKGLYRKGYVNASITLSFTFLFNVEQATDGVTPIISDVKMKAPNGYIFNTNEERYIYTDESSAKLAALTFKGFPEDVNPADIMIYDMTEHGLISTFEPYTG